MADQDKEQAAQLVTQILQADQTYQQLAQRYAASRDFNERQQIVGQMQARLVQLNGGQRPQGLLIDPTTGTAKPDPNTFLRVALPVMLAAVGGYAALGGFAGAGGAAAGSAAGGDAAGGTLASTQIGSGMAGTQAAVPSAMAAGGIGGGGTGFGAAGGGIFGALGKWGPMAGDIGRVLGEAAGASADGRRQDAQTNAYATAANNRALVDAATFNRDLPSIRTNQVSRGEVLNTMQDAPLTGDQRIDKFSGGGLRPSAFGPNSRAAGSELSRQAMSKLMDPASDQLKPQMVDPTKASGWENAGAGIGLGLDIFSLLEKYGRGPNAAG